MRRSLIARARKIDHGYTVKFGSLCKDHGVKHFHLLTSMGSNPNSWFLYPKTKGQVLFPLPSLGRSACAVVRLCVHLARVATQRVPFWDSRTRKTSRKWTLREPPSGGRACSVAETRPAW